MRVKVKVNRNQLIVLAEILIVMAVVMAVAVMAAEGWL
jgi:hypothetical protein